MAGQKVVLPYLRLRPTSKVKGAAHGASQAHDVGSIAKATPAIEIQLSYQDVNPCGERIQNVSKNLRIVAASTCWDMKRVIGLREHLE